MELGQELHDKKVIFETETQEAFSCYWSMKNIQSSQKGVGKALRPYSGDGILFSLVILCWEPPCLVSEAVTPMVKAESELGP